ncbi:hypothetical protein ACFQ80_05820 [Isoptericola sp. NPDC056578]
MHKLPKPGTVKNPPAQFTGDERTLARHWASLAVSLIEHTGN